MKTIAVASSKGGVGKTTICAMLAVCAAREYKRVCVVDLDPTESLAEWHKRRGSPDNPHRFTGEDSASEAIEKLELTGWDLVFLDLPPAFRPTMQDAIESADLVIIPLRPSSLDLIASEDAVMMAEEADTPRLVVLNDAEPRWRTTSAARDYLLAAGVPVAETIIAHRQAYLAAMSSGRVGPEIDKSRKGSDGKTPTEREVSDLWAEVKSALKKAAQGKKGARRG